MLIRSQDKRMIVNLYNICTVSASPEKHSEDIYVEDGTGSLMVGRYSTKAKAMKVLDMVQDAYERYEYEKGIQNWAYIVRDISDARRWECGSMKYKCVKAFTLDTYDGDGFYVDGYMEIEVGEVYEVGNENIIDGEIHLDGVNVNRWIEISKETLEKYFVEVEA